MNYFAGSLRAACLPLLCALTVGAAAPKAFAQGAQDYPVRAIHIVVPFAPGGTSDVLARAIGQKLTETWGQPVVVDNRPGAGGNIGADSVAKAVPDGYTLLLLDMSTLTIGPSIYARLSYNPLKDFAPVTAVAASTFVMAVNPALPINSVKQLIAYGKANPGKLTFASSGIGTSVHLAAEQFRLMTGIDMTHVPYKGGAAALVGVIGGEVSVTLQGLIATLPHIKAGRLRAIAVGSAKRSPAAPELPTIAESGLPGYQAGTVQGLLAPGGTPRDVVQKLNAAVVRILNTPEMKERLASQGAEVIGNTPEQFAAFIRDDTEKWAKVVKEIGLKPE